MSYESIFTDEPSSLQTGMTIGNLHILEFLGKGGLGEVYLTQHVILDKRFAIKVLPKGFEDDNKGDVAFKKAARIQTKLDHPNIIRIDDLGDEGLFYWMRMEYIEGDEVSGNRRIRSLQNLMDYNKGPLTEDEVCYYLYHALVGLQFAHELGVIHSDLKPSNIMLGEEGAKIGELGVAELIGHAWDDFHIFRREPRFEPTPFDPLPGFSRQLPALLHTYDYFSPEQKAGQNPNVASNLYSMGLMAYRTLTGRHTLSLVPPTRAVTRINPRWDAWMERAVAYEPEERFSSALEMLETMPGLEQAEENPGEGDTVEASA